MRLAGHVAGMRYYYLKVISCENVDSISSGSGYSSVASSYEHNNKHSGSMKAGEFLNQISDYLLRRGTLLHKIALANFN
jgi:hypothetical protein